MRMWLRPIAILAFALAAGPVASKPLSCSPGPFIVFFERNSSAFNVETRSILDNAIEQSGYCGSAQALIDGHTDKSEIRDLSYVRALDVRDYLVEHGFPLKATTVRSFGNDSPRKTDGADADLQNRRVEITYGPLPDRP